MAEAPPLALHEAEYPRRAPFPSDLLCLPAPMSAATGARACVRRGAQKVLESRPGWNTQGQKDSGLWPYLQGQGWERTSAAEFQGYAPWVGLPSYPRGISRSQGEVGARKAALPPLGSEHGNRHQAPWAQILPSLGKVFLVMAHLSSSPGFCISHVARLQPGV